MANRSADKRLTAFDVWGRLGITEHPGGYRATRRLAELCGLRPGQRVLDIGCGTGYTACLLAKEYGASVVAADLAPDVLAWARKRVAKEGVGDRVTLLVADAQNLPFEAKAFDAVIVESVLIFCDQVKAASQAHRVLKPGGVLGDNEVTFLKSPPTDLREFFSRAGLGVEVRFLREDEWRAVYREAGFAGVSSSVNKLNLWEQFLSHLRVDGVWKYTLASIQSFLDPEIRAAFLNLHEVKAAFRFLPYVGYSLYVCRKAPSPNTVYLSPERHPQTEAVRLKPQILAVADVAP